MNQSTLKLISKKELQELINSSRSKAEVLKKLNLYSETFYYKILDERIELENIDLSQMEENEIKASTLQMRRARTGSKKPHNEIFCKESKYGRKALKNRILNEKLIPYCCSKCENEGVHNGKPLILQLDHINGVNNDNRLENLRFLCPNCHSQTSTYAGKGKRVKYPCPKCGQRMHKDSTVCQDCARENKTHKIKWPTEDELRKLIWSKPISKVSKEIGVSDSAIIKRCKKLSISRPPMGYWLKK